MDRLSFFVELGSWTFYILSPVLPQTKTFFSDFMLCSKHETKIATKRLDKILLSLGSRI